MHTFKLAVAGLMLSASTAALAQTADRIWTGGTILTMEDDAMRAEAVAEDDGKIIAVGSAAEVMKLKGPKTEVIDLKGRALVPGFVDAHGHIMIGGLQSLSANMLAPPDGEVTDMASMQRVMREWIAANSAAIKQANLIIGFGYDNAQLAELRHPTREDLDKISTEYPVLLVHQSGHLGAVNSKALEVAGISADTKDPVGGIIRRLAGSQEPDGVLEETAMMMVAGKLITSIGEQGMMAFAKAGAETWASYGYTTVEEGRSFPVMWPVLKKVADAGGFKVDVKVYHDLMLDRDTALANYSPTYTNRLRMAGGKVSLDGSPQGFTAWRDKPYYDPVGNYPVGYSGDPAAKEADLIGAIDWAYQNDLPIIVHVAGERAGDLLISAADAAEKSYGKKDRRTVLIHGHFTRVDQMDSYKRLGIVPSLFPMHTFYWGDWHRDHTVGPVAADNISPTGWAVTRGMKFSSHHDAPVALPDSMRVLDATVTRRSRSGDIIGPAQRIDVITALKAMTLWPAYHSFEDDQKGSIKVGKLADFAILDKDPTAVDPETLDQLRVVETIKEGVSIYRRPARAAAAESAQSAKAMAAFSEMIGEASGMGHGSHGGAQ